MQASLCLLLQVLAVLSTGYLLPNPKGSFNVSLTTGTLIDSTRNVFSNGSGGPRELMLSVFQPNACASKAYVQYMPDQTAGYQGPYLQQQFNLSVDLSPLFLGAELPVCADDPSTYADHADTPVLLLSPGWGIPRLYYSVIASAIASQGFTVITIDHPGDANIITYPDGHVVYGLKLGVPTDEEFTQLTYIRAADASFIINQLSNETAISHLFSHSISTERIVMAGHSLGGAAAVLAASQDSRIRGAIDWDGSLFGTLPEAGLSTPVLYISEENATDPSWVAAWPKLTGPKLWLEVEGTTHQSFSDALTLIAAAWQDLGPFQDFLGTIEPGKMVEVLVKSTKAWMDGVSGGDFEEALAGGTNGSGFSEVKALRKDNF